MADRYVPALWQRFLDDMRIEGLLAKTQTMYLRAMRDSTRFLKRHPFDVRHERSPIVLKSRISGSVG